MSFYQKGNFVFIRIAIVCISRTRRSVGVFSETISFKDAQNQLKWAVKILKKDSRLIFFRKERIRYLPVDLQCGIIPENASF